MTAALRSSQVSSKKTTSFKDEVESRLVARQSIANEDAIDTDDDEEDEEDGDDDDDVSESAIEDEEDSSDWEDSATDSGAASPPQRQWNLGDRSKPPLVSRRSLLTTMVHESERAAALAGEASKSQPVIYRHGGSLLRPDDRSFKGEFTGDSQGDNIPRSKPITMATPTTQAHNALSPRTTRRNMLATELTESLRKHLLWERQQKYTTVNAAIKRRHTAHDGMANLKQYPEKHNHESGTNSKNNSWNAYNDHGLGEYNSRGW